MVSDATRLPPSKCPACEHLMDAATDVDGDAKPKPGDFSLCSHCASVLVFDDRLHLALPTHEQLQEAPDDVWRVQQAVKKVAKVEPRYERAPCGCMFGTEEPGEAGGGRAFVFIPHAQDCELFIHVQAEMAKSGKPVITLDAR